MTSHRLLLDDVVTAVRVAGDVAMKYFGRPIQIDAKLDGSPVTIADLSAERAVREWIAGRYPGDAVLGEEFGQTSGETGRQWLVDPIDGTTSFVRGVPLWGSLVGVAEGDRVVAGAIFCPAADLLVAAADGCGCTCNGVPCHVSSVDLLAEATILTTDDRFAANPGRAALWQALGARVAISRTWGDCYGYALVAAGRAELMVDDRLAPWDAAPLLPIMREAGGVFSDWKGGHSHHGSDAVATNAVLSSELLMALHVPR